MGSAVSPHLNPIATAITAIVISSLLIAQLDCLNVIPEKLYTSTTLFLAKDRVTDTLKHYQVEEYVDLNSKRSSILLRQHWRDEKTQIYYNQIGQNELLAQRKLLMFDVETNSCRDDTSVSPKVTIGYWELAILRRVAILLYTSSQPVQQRWVDIAIGPSVLLYAVQNTLDEFQFKETKLASSRMAYVDVFERRVQIETVDDYSELDIKVSIKSRRPGGGAKSGSAERAAETLSETVKLDQNQLEIASIVACKVLEDSDSDDDDLDKASSGAPPESTNDNIKHIPGSLACGGAERVLFHIDYNLVEEYSLASLTGRRIYEQFDYDFHREPFVQPVGIGCWNSLADHKWQKSFWRPSLQFSAEYQTNNGSRGLSYVAFDGYSNVMRLDRFGRKSVYDLSSRLAYHVGEFSSAHESNSRSVDEDVSMEKCLVLKIGEETLEPSRAMTRLLGLNTFSTTRHLGSKLIDHVQYEVFETDLEYVAKFGYNLPILLEPIRYAAETNFYSTKHYYVTYYVHEYPNMNKLSSRSQDGREEQSATYSVPKFVELWEFNKQTRQRRLVNRLVFTQFAWSLDVMPSNDPDTQLHLDNLFNIQQCHQTRATQAELEFFIAPLSETSSMLLNKQPMDSKAVANPRLEALEQSITTIEEIVHERLANILGISRLSIDSLEAKLVASSGGQLAVKSRIVELAEGIEYLIPQGAVRFYEKLLDDYIEKIYFNRHSLDECKLDSASWPRDNWLAYCGKLTLCVILKQDEDLSKELAKRREESQKAAAQTGDEKQTGRSSPMIESVDDTCQVYSFKYLDLFDQHEMRTIKLVEENEYKISGTRFSFDYKFVNPESGRVESAKYGGFGLVSHLRLLDPTGAKWGVGAQTMVGLSYTTSREEPMAFNMNRRVELLLEGGKASLLDDTFKHCQLACQMDEFCGSFSVCLRRNKQRKQPSETNSGQQLASNDCVLSSMRLTGPRLASLAKLSRKSQKEAKQKLEMKVVGEHLSQVYVIQRDADCSLHSKDFLSEYSSIFEYLPNSYSKTIAPPAKGKKTKLDYESGSGNNNSTKAAAAPANKNEGGPTGDVTIEHKSQSLEECAGLSFERHLDVESSLPSKFTYCPLERHCFLSDNELLELDKKRVDSRFCRVYDRNYRHFYNSKPMTHMRIAFENAKTKQTVNKQGEQREEAQYLIDAIGEEFRRLDLIKTYWGLSGDECARECNLHRSKCLAFDSCKEMGKKLCILYSIRSPKSSPNLPLTRKELQLKQETTIASAASSSPVKFSSVRLNRNDLCEHSWLKSSYFSIRLKQFLAIERQSDAEETSVNNDRPPADSSSTLKRDKLVESIEKKISDLDEKRNETEYKSLDGVEEELAQQLAAADQSAQAAQQATLADKTAKTTTSGGIQFSMLLIGLLIGCVCTLFKSQIMGATTSLYNLYLMRRGTSTGAESLSQLVLNDHL